MTSGWRHSTSAAWCWTKALSFCCASTAFLSKTVPFLAVLLDQVLDSLTDQHQRLEQQQQQQLLLLQAEGAAAAQQVSIDAGSPADSGRHQPPPPPPPQLPQPPPPPPPPL
eukprot:SAG22_NODE_1492_length_4303_cov_15.785205_1_plen_110_part_10